MPRPETENRYTSVEQKLAQYAARSLETRGREHTEPPPVGRSEFQRDRDRVIHSTAFRRLVYKTQVFVNHEGDHYRTRLTHSLEVAQIARTIARAMNLNEDLVEAISLSHDLGHTPFGHAGQDSLNACMRDYGGFEHNLQSLRVVEHLENRYANFEGLNLTFETREGILKHCSQKNAAELGGLGMRFIERRQPSLEAQLANVADEIAYNNHDVDDGLRSGLIKLKQLKDIPFFCEQMESVRSSYPDIPNTRLNHEIVRRMINVSITDLLSTSQQMVDKANPNSIDAVRALERPLISFSDPFIKGQVAVKHFLRQALYRHPRVQCMTKHATEVITTLFNAFIEKYERMPEEHAGRAHQYHRETGIAGGARVVADYIAGMTDRFALQTHEKL